METILSSIWLIFSVFIVPFFIAWAGFFIIFFGGFILLTCDKRMFLKIYSFLRIQK